MSNKDGVKDLAITSAIGYGDKFAYVVYGPINSDIDLSTISPEQGIILRSDQSLAYAPNFVGAVEDFDNDGYKDFVVADSYADVGSTIGSGKVVVITNIFGSATYNPTMAPNSIPKPTLYPSVRPTRSPTFVPTLKPTIHPTILPTSNPTSNPTGIPTAIPTSEPTGLPTSSEPSSTPTDQPTFAPNLTQRPSQPTFKPSAKPSKLPTIKPTSKPSSVPSSKPSKLPTYLPSKMPSNIPSVVPSVSPTLLPTKKPTRNPSRSPSSKPTKRVITTLAPSLGPTLSSSAAPSSAQNNSLTVNVSGNNKNNHNQIILASTLSFSLSAMAYLIFAKLSHKWPFNNYKIKPQLITSLTEEDIFKMIKELEERPEIIDQTVIMKLSNYLSHPTMEIRDAAYDLLYKIITTKNNNLEIIFNKQVIENLLNLHSHPFQDTIEFSKVILNSLVLKEESFLLTINEYININNLNRENFNFIYRQTLNMKDNDYESDSSSSSSIDNKIMIKSLFVESESDNSQEEYFRNLFKLKDLSDSESSDNEVESSDESISDDQDSRSSPIVNKGNIFQNDIEVRMVREIIYDNPLLNQGYLPITGSETKKLLEDSRTEQNYKLPTETGLYKQPIISIISIRQLIEYLPLVQHVGQTYISNLGYNITLPKVEDNKMTIIFTHVMLGYSAAQFLPTTEIFNGVVISSASSLNYGAKLVIADYVQSEIKVTSNFELIRKCSINIVTYSLSDLFRISLEKALLPNSINQVSLIDLAASNSLTVVQCYNEYRLLNGEEIVYTISDRVLPYLSDIGTLLLISQNHNFNSQTTIQTAINSLNIVAATYVTHHVSGFMVSVIPSEIKEIYIDPVLEYIGENLGSLFFS